ncbi:serpin family protein [Fadolivirus algeromassiliense]|jgi:serpin B|uniref:Serpin family protein n=1 Tax=Fadolivirus FV1/VV64 TaxID=3070911 RepID=A0A7D3QU94_9VIRU|nr:serpin family protein [Fadolivirus algeromassiliense]QKF93965.1 serpin family protein [Fadolivirus FV1/VV64]
MLRNKENYDDDMHQFNVQRRMMERNFGLEDDNKPKNGFVPFSRYDDRLKDIGEITGDSLDSTFLEKGMPFRPKTFTSSDRYAFDETQNGYLDFNLYDTKSDIRVSYFDPYNTQSSATMSYSSLNDESKILNKLEHTNNEAMLSEIINVFSLDFMLKFSEHIKSKKSLILSPFSILQAFCLLYFGSKGNTEKELRDYFSLPDKKTTFNSLYKITNLMTNSNVFNKMNLLCVPNYVMVNDAYLSYINRLGNIIKVDLKNINNETSRINNLISKSTNGMINNIIQPAMLSQSLITLINTIYFYSKWKNQFNPSYTRQEPFYGINKLMVNMMSQNDKTHRYFEDDINQVLEMDYVDGQFCMGFILPKSQYREAIVSNEQFNYYISQLQEKEISLVKIPKFKHETSYRVDNLFKKYGMKQIFKDADISDIIPPTHGFPIFISSIVHSAVIVVDEAGTKAAAATAMYLSNSISTNKKISFIANHQFMYYIRFKPYNTIVFIGQYY